MTDLVALAALLALVVLVESSTLVRLPIGLLLAIGALGADLELLPVVLVGALGTTLARLALALQARRGRDRRATSPAAAAQRDAVRTQLAGAPAYARITFLLAALPGVPANFLFPTLGAMRTPLGAALAGTVVGRIPLLAITTALFIWLGQLLATTDDQAAAIGLGVLAIVLLVLRTIAQIDWQHHQATGAWRLRDTERGAARMTSMFAGAAGHDTYPSTREPDDIVEGELLGEEDDDESPHPGNRTLGPPQ